MATPKQALLLIHGIGEQRPMESLNSFIQAAWTTHTELHVKHNNEPDALWSKPDRVSGSAELRRLTTPSHKGVNGNVRTDFFEFYWAHLMTGTTYGHVVDWVKTLAFRSPVGLPRNLKLLWALLWFVIILVGIVYAWAAFTAIETPSSGWSAVLAAAVSTLLVPMAGGVIKWVVGDAARYLYPAPSNVERRAQIREAGVKLLEELHAREYERIIIVGHSLGTVIGYDILKECWALHFRDFNEAPAGNSSAALQRLEALARQEEGVTRAQQREALRELRAMGHYWKVTDFVTLGSPLAHAEVLMARNRADLEARQDRRELPTCPPMLESEQTFTYSPQIIVAGEETDTNFTTPHHAGHFALTHWQNLYFESRNIIRGDFIGGPLARVFGGWIKDVSLTTRRWGGLFSHTSYWWQKGGATSEHITALRSAINLADEDEVLVDEGAASTQPSGPTSSSTGA